MPYTCFVHFCTSGYKKRKTEGGSGESRSVSLFQPKTLEQVEKWRKAIPRSDRMFSKKDRVCALHFNSDDISWYYDEVKMPDGKFERVKRGKPKLSDDAVPSHFPNCPPYPSKNVKTRKTPTPRNPIIVKNRTTQHQDPTITDSSSDQFQNNEDRREETNHENQNSETEENFILNFVPPGGWVRNIIDDKIVFFKWSGQSFERHFVISKDGKMMFFLNNKRIKIPLEEMQCSSVAVISKVFEDFSNIKPYLSIAENNTM